MSFIKGGSSQVRFEEAFRVLSYIFHLTYLNISMVLTTSKTVNLGPNAHIL